MRHTALDKAQDCEMAQETSTAHDMAPDSSQVPPSGPSDVNPPPPTREPQTFTQHTRVGVDGNIESTAGPSTSGAPPGFTNTIPNPMNGGTQDGMFENPGVSNFNNVQVPL